MSSRIEPEYRLRSLQRKLGDLLMGRRLSADSESTGIVDLSDLNASRFIHTTGQSGLPAQPHYDDFTDKWRNIHYVPMWWDAGDIKINAEGTLTLTP